MPQSYQFRTCWHVAAPVETVYPIINEAANWPQWWPAVRSVRAFQSSADPAAEMQEQHWRTPFGYSFSFTLQLMERVPLRLLRARASGMLQGMGEWRFEPVPGGCQVSFAWKVQTSVAWMNRLAWLLRPLFVYNHRLVMAQGRKGLQRLLQAKVADCNW